MFVRGGEGASINPRDRAGEEEFMLCARTLLSPELHVGHLPSSSVKAERSKPKFRLCSLYIVGEIGFCSLSSVKKIDCLKEKGKKES